MATDRSPHEIAARFSPYDMADVILLCNAARGDKTTYFGPMQELGIFDERGQITPLGREVARYLEEND